MPLYDYRNKETGEVEEHFVKFDDAEQFLIDNPHLERRASAPNFSQRVNMHAKQPDSWKDVLRKTKEAHPLGNVDV